MTSSIDLGVALPIFFLLVIAGVFLDPRTRPLPWWTVRALGSVARRRSPPPLDQVATLRPHQALLEILGIVVLSTAGSILASIVISGLGEGGPVGAAQPSIGTQILPPSNSASVSPSLSPPSPRPILFTVGYETLYDLKVIVPGEDSLINASGGESDRVTQVDVTADGDVIGCAFDRAGTAEHFVLGNLTPDNLVNLRVLPVPLRYGCSSPVFSPDGTKVAFICIGESSSILNTVCSLDTSAPAGVTRLASPFKFVYGLDWSFDGGSLLVSAEGDYRHTGLCAADPESGRFGRQVGYAVGDIALSPDGKRLVDATRRGLYVEKMTGPLGTHVATRITTGETYSPSWSPDGTEIAFVPIYRRPGGSLVIVDVSTGHERVQFRAPYLERVQSQMWLGSPRCLN